MLARPRLGVSKSKTKAFHKFKLLPLLFCLLLASSFHGIFKVGENEGIVQVKAISWTRGCVWGGLGAAVLRLEGGGADKRPRTKYHAWPMNEATVTF